MGCRGTLGVGAWGGDVCAAHVVAAAGMMSVCVLHVSELPTVETLNTCLDTQPPDAKSKCEALNAIPAHASKPVCSC